MAKVLLPPVTECGKVMFSVVSVCHSLIQRVRGLHADHYLNLFKLIYLGTSSHCTHLSPPNTGTPSVPTIRGSRQPQSNRPPDMFKQVHLDLTVHRDRPELLETRAVGLPLKGLSYLNSLFGPMHNHFVLLIGQKLRLVFVQ